MLMAFFMKKLNVFLKRDMQYAVICINTYNIKFHCFYASYPKIDLQESIKQMYFH